MEAIGIIRRIDDLGRIVIPKEVRRQYGIVDGDRMEILPTTDGIIVRKYTADKTILAYTQNLRDAIREEEGLTKEKRVMLLQQVKALEEELVSKEVE